MHGQTYIPDELDKPSTFLLEQKTSMPILEKLYRHSPMVRSMAQNYHKAVKMQA